jgi:hypothetical protein
VSFWSNLLQLLTPAGHRSGSDAWAYIIERTGNASGLLIGSTTTVQTTLERVIFSRTVWWLYGGTKGACITFRCGWTTARGRLPWTTSTPL